MELANGVSETRAARTIARALADDVQVYGNRAEPHSVYRRHLNKKTIHCVCVEERKATRRNFLTFVDLVSDRSSTGATIPALYYLVSGRG